MPLEKTRLSRRKFLGAMATLAGVAVATAGPDFIKPNEAPQKDTQSSSADDIGKKMNMCRNPQLAKGLTDLANNGRYKKIAFIYGINHVDPVEKCILRPEETTRKFGSPEDQNSMFGKVSKLYPDSVKIFRLTPGQNNSDRFVASKDMAWERINKD
jgi:hypothetical protein